MTEESPSPRSGPLAQPPSQKRLLEQTLRDTPPELTLTETDGTATPDTSSRRPSVHFSASGSMERKPASLVRQSVDFSKGGHPTSTTKAGGRRMSSPPPPATFQARVSFDTIANSFDPVVKNEPRRHDPLAALHSSKRFDPLARLPNPVDISFTLNYKHNAYQYTKRSRTFLCGTDSNSYSEFALEWLIEELVDDGDEIVCLRVIDRDSRLASDSNKIYREEAEKYMQKIIEKNVEGKALSFVLEFSVGKVQDQIQQMIKIYEPAILVVGTRGRSLQGFQGLLPGSVSKYCLQHSPVPVIVVRPTSKRLKKKQKRANDPSRQGYRDILDRSSGGSHVLEKGRRDFPTLVGDIGLGGFNGELMEPTEATEEEQLAVARAIGWNQPTTAKLEEFGNARKVSNATARERNRELPPIETRARDSEGAPLSKVPSAGARSDISAQSPDSPFVGGSVMRSPDLTNLESPDVSDNEGGGVEEDDDGEEEEEEEEVEEEGEESGPEFEAVPADSLLLQRQRSDRGEHRDEDEDEEDREVKGGLSPLEQRLANAARAAEEQRREKLDRQGKA